MYGLKKLNFFKYIIKKKILIQIGIGMKSGLTIILECIFCIVYLFLILMWLSIRVLQTMRMVTSAVDVPSDGIYGHCVWSDVTQLVFVTKDIFLNMNCIAMNNDY